MPFPDLEVQLSTPPGASAAPQTDLSRVITPTDPAGHFLYGRQILELTDRLNSAESYTEAAAITDHVLDPIDGLLARLGEFFEAAGRKAMVAGLDEGLDLAHDFDDAASDIRALGEDLHVAVDEMQALGAPPPLIPPAQATTHFPHAVARGSSPALLPVSPPASATPAAPVNSRP